MSKTDKPTCYACNNTEVIFNSQAALITHDGSAGETENTIAQNVDAIFQKGAFAKLRASGSFMDRQGATLDDPADYYALVIDPALIAELDKLAI